MSNYDAFLMFIGFAQEHLERAQVAAKKIGHRHESQKEIEQAVAWAQAAQRAQ